MLYDYYEYDIFHQVKVENFGHQYKLLTSQTIEEIVDAIEYFAHREMETLYSQLAARDSPLGFFSENDIETFIQALKDREGISKFLRSLREPGHVLRWGEGRGGRGKTMRLPLIPLAGKYLHLDVTEKRKYSPTPYKSCNYCNALAAFGLLKATYPVRVGKNRVIISIPFEGKVEGDYLSNFFEFHLTYWREFYEELSRRYRVAEQLPVRTTIFLVVSTFSGELMLSMAESPARWHAIGINFSGRPSAPEIRGFYDVNISSFVKGLSDLYKAGFLGLSSLGNLLHQLSIQGEARALDALFTFISERKVDALYHFSRWSYLLIERLKGKEKEPGRVRGVERAFHTMREIAIALLERGGSWLDFGAM